jgi:hypothetical protein
LFGRYAIATVIIDGYNLIGTGHRNLEEARETLIQALIAYRPTRENEIVLVFDGHKGGMGPQNRSVKGGVEIVYSGLGESADNLIKRMISAGRRDWIVITSDREIAQFAWSREAVPVPSERFANILDGAGMSQDGRDEGSDDDEEYDQMPRGGNPHKLSKKDRALQRALGKL